MGRVYAITDKDVLEQCRGYLAYNNQSKRDLVLFEIGCKCLLRVGDILNLRVGDVYLKKTLNIKLEKNYKRVDIPIPKKLQKLLNEYCKGKNKYEYLIKSQKGFNEPISKVQAYRILKRMEGYLGLKEYGVGTHSMRKTGAYFLFKETKDIELVKRLLGHKTNNQVFAYIYSGLKSDRELMDSVDY